MSDPILYVLLVLAIAIGWLLGRLGRSHAANQEDGSPHSHYYEGLNFLLDEQPDGALDAFINALEVNSDTLETHLAVGNLMRRKGEMERAIRIHQNLLARPSLSPRYLHLAHLELARDFIGAGLFDRAERLLEDLVEGAPEQRDTALRHLLEIYQDEKDWQRAIEVGQKLLPRKLKIKSHLDEENSDIPVALAHYSCELAELALAKNDYYTARRGLKRALHYDRGCVRALLLLARVEFETANYAKAIKALRRVRDIDPIFLAEVVTLLKQCFERIGHPEEFQTFLGESLEQCPSATVMLALVEDLQKRRGEAAAADFISHQLRQRPSLKGLDKLVQIHIANSDGRARDNLKILHMLIEQLMENRPTYQCRHCGFAGKQLHWLCPSCKRWGEISAIRGAEGE